MFFLHVAISIQNKERCAMYGNTGKYCLLFLRFWSQEFRCTLIQSLVDV